MNTTCQRSFVRALLVTVVVFTALWGASQAAPPAASSPPYESSGIVNYIDNVKNQIVVSDREFDLPINVPVHSGSSVVSRNVLSKGMRVGYKQAGSTVTEIWILSR